MNMYEIITKKKHGIELSREEIREVVFAYTKGEIPDYQISALLMAIYFKGMTEGETVSLTEAITDSGNTLDLSCFGALTVDKHSSGGVGDKTTLIVAPIAAVLGCKVAKMTGRGLGHTGGTADKLESINGFDVSLPKDRFLRQVEEIGIAVVAQNVELAPADKKIYALRDVTATVDSIPLIVSSIMGKKLAAGSKNIVLDVKYGSGSFMKSASDAEILAENMVKIGNACGRRTRALITSMEEPLGFAVGNSLEVIEAIEALKGDGPADLIEVSTSLAACMVECAKGIPTEDARAMVKDAIESGAAFKKLCEWIYAQGGDVSLLHNTEKFKEARYKHPILSGCDGYIKSIDAEAVGLSALALGAGRKTKDDVIDHSAGIILKAKVGDRVAKGDVIAYLHTNSEASIEAGAEKYSSAVKYSDNPTKKPPLIYKTI